MLKSYRNKLPKHLVYPVGVQAISEALLNAPHGDEFRVWFRNNAAPQAYIGISNHLSRYTIKMSLRSNFRQPPLSHFLQLIEMRKPYVFVKVEYNTKRYNINWDERWYIYVYPVDYGCRQLAKCLIQEQIFPIVAKWLHSSQVPEWGMIDRRLEFVFNPQKESITVTEAQGRELC